MIRLSRLFPVFAVASGLIVMAAPAAHAFTIDNQSNTTSSGAARYADPDEQFSSGSGSGSGGANSYHYGNATVQFGSPTQGQSFDQRYNPSRMFDPLGGPGRDGYR